MAAAIASFLLAIGCAQATFVGPAGPFAVWVCPPVQEEAPPDAPDPAPKPEESPS